MRSPRPFLGLLVTLILAVSGHAPRQSQASAAEVALPPAQVPSDPAASAEQGPDRLKKQVRITVETNSPPASGKPPREKSLHWEARWEGWNGLQLDLSRKTIIEDPLADLREDVNWTNAPRVLHLEEMRMTGKIGAKIAVDAAAYATSKDCENLGPGIELRRVRLYAKGNCGGCE